MKKRLFIIFIFFACTKSGITFNNEVDKSQTTDKELITLRFTQKCEVFKVVSTSSLRRNLIRASIGKQELDQNRKTLEVFIKESKKINNYLIVKNQGKNLTLNQIEKFKEIYLKNVLRLKFIEDRLMSNRGCGFEPGYCLSFYHNQDRVDFIFCFSCNEYKVVINGLENENRFFFDYAEDELETFVESLFK